MAAFPRAPVSEFMLILEEMRDSVDLYELQLMVREGVEAALPSRVWVCAEVASVQVKANGHCYIELCRNRDGRTVARAKAVIWRNVYGPLSIYFREAAGEDIKAGMEILAGVQVSYSELYGLTLTIYEIEPAFTIGAAELQRCQTIARLQEEGLLDRQKLLTPTAVPYRLAVISARDAAGFGDFRRHLEENEYGFVFSVRLFEAAMQGEAAPESISDAIASVEAAPEKYDAILIMRGGGSSLDLGCFDDYGLCFTIANCGIPVYTAIGHDRDSHVADMVAFRAVKTPTALADLFVDALAAEDERISSFGTRLRLAFASRLAAMDSALDLLAARIKSADPRNLLARGYTLVADASGRVLKSAVSVRPGDGVRVLFADGSLEAEVKSIHSN